MSTAAALRDEGLALCRQKDFTAGEAKLKEALAADPADFATIEALIKVRGIQNDLAGARAYLQQALATDPSAVKPRHAYGLLAYNQGNYDEAREVFRQLIEINQKDAEAHFQLANICRKENRTADAIRHYNLCIDAQPGHALSYNNLGLVHLGQDNPSDAIAAFKQAIAFEQKNPTYQMNLAKALESAERYNEATKVWEQLLTLDLKPEQQSEVLERLSVAKSR